MAADHTSFDPSTQAALVALVRSCQAGYAAWKAAVDGQAQERAIAEYHRLLEELWAAIADSLRAEAKKWMCSGLATDTESLALNMFADIVIALPGIDVDEGRNVRALLRRIARFDTIDEYNKLCGTPRRRESEEDGSPARVRPSVVRLGAPVYDEDGAAGEASSELPDPDSFGAEDRIVARIDATDLMREVQNRFWPETLQPEDRRIVDLRWSSDPPMPFGEIARLLGTGWQEEAVRQRHHRIMKRTRQYLRQQGMIE